MKIDWGKFHDATFVGINLLWLEGIAVMTLRLREEITINFSGLKRLNWERTFPWGPSESINTVTIEEGNPNWVFKFEIQSGDVLTIECTDVTLQK